MSHSLLLRAMIAKELRGIFRERQQFYALLISLLLSIGLTVALVIKLKLAAQPTPSRPVAASATNPTTNPGPKRPGTPNPLAQAAQLDPQLQVMIFRWMAIAAGVGVTVFFSLGYLIAATLATFAGEKDDRTLEILLACPVPDTTLLLTKCISVLLSMTAIGFLFLLLPASAALVFLRPQLARMPISLPVHALLLSIPLTFLINTSLVVIGAAVSAKAQSLKSANQAFGGIIFIVLFGGAYGLPLLLSYTRLGKPVAEFAKAWLTMPFPVQYLLAVLIFALPALLFTLVARSLFRRDRLLA